MRTLLAAPALFVLAVITACAPKEGAKGETTAMAPAPAMAPAAKTPASFAGTWSTTATLDGVAKPVPTTLVGSADGATWTVSLEGRPNVAATASMSGDSLIVQTAEYESVLRKGVMVTTRTASVMSDSTMMTGNMVALYKTPKGVEEVKGTIMAMRAPK
ncbi:MAG: hypothetical protein ABI120_23845 [Gemmatimonadaceae bacterium]